MAKDTEIYGKLFLKLDFWDWSRYQQLTGNETGIQHLDNTVWYCYNAVIFLTNVHKKRPIARRQGEVWGVFCRPSL